MRILFLSDVHGNQYAFYNVLKIIDRYHPDEVIFLGDVFGYYYGQEEILTILRTSGWKCLLGNHDKMFLDLIDGRENLEQLCCRYGSSYRRNLKLISDKNILFLQGLRSYFEFRCKGIKIGAFHGSPADSLNGRIYPDTELKSEPVYEKFDVIFCGHTHHKMLRSVGSTLICNPGSIGQQRDGKGCSFAVFDTDTRKFFFQIVDFPVQKLVDEIAVKDPGNTRLVEVLWRNRKEKDV